MPIIPTGAPSWLRTNNFATYGGDANKRNYMGQGSVDPTSDVSAEQFSRMVEDVAELARVGEFATLTYVCNDSSPGAPTVVHYDAMVGAAPTGTRNGNGDVTWKWAAAYTDAYSVSGSLNIGHAKAGVQNSNGTSIANHVISDSDADGLNDSVRVVATSGGSALSNARVTLTIWTSVP